MKATRILLTLIAIFCLSPIWAQEAEKAAIENLKKKSDIRFGESENEDIENARQAARNALLSTFKSAASYSNSLDMGDDADGNGHLDTSTASTFATTAVLDNVKEISYSYSRTNGKQETETYHVFLYITEAQYQKLQDDRRTEELELIKDGQRMENGAYISSALKYYNWALTSISAYNDNDLKIDIDGEERLAATFLRSKIESMLANLKFNIKDGKVIEHPEAYDKYSIVVNASYGGLPVSTIDIKYFDGEGNRTVHGKDGEIILDYPELSTLKDVKFTVEYAYKEEAEHNGGIVSSAYKTITGGAYKNRKSAQVSIPLNYKPLNGTVKRSESVPTTASATIAPAVTEGRPRQQRNYADNATDYIQSMQAVEQAIRSSKPMSVKSLFTERGFEIFYNLTTKSKLKVVGSPTYTVETSPLFIIGRQIPVTINRGGHSSRENIVFRFDGETGLIKSVAFALTERAENDIVREAASWDIDSKYSILTFMEDYQTAFHTQDEKYIQSIFSDDAIIITGKFTDSSKTKFIDDIQLSRANKKRNVSYSHYTRDEYMKHLHNMFSNNKWTHISFEENVISKINTGGLIQDNELMWVELKQNWTSSSYSDVGYLSLQVNLVPNGSKINVRVWTPEFVEINDLKKRFPVGSSL